MTHLTFFSLRFCALVIWCIPVDDSDIINVELKDSTGATVNINVSDFFESAGYSGDWNSSTSSVDFSGQFLATGYWMVFPEGVELPAGQCSHEVINKAKFEII